VFRVGKEEDDEDEAVLDIPIKAVTVSAIGEMQKKDPEILRIKQDMLENPEDHNAKKFHLRSDVVYYKDKQLQKDIIYVPIAMRLEILRFCHDIPLSGHLGFTKTYHKIKTRFYWKSMRKDTYHFVSSCDDCQSRKIPRMRKQGFMQLQEIPGEAFAKVIIDVLGPLTRSASGHSYIVNCMCATTKYMEAKAIRHADAESVAEFLVNSVILRHGTPRIIASDRGTIFLSDMFTKAMELLGISQQISTFNHPGTVGLVEKSHDYLHVALTMYTDANQKNWPQHLQALVFAYNSSIQLSTFYSPHFLLYGREPILPIEADATLTNHLSLQEIINNMNLARSITRERLMIRQKQYAKYFNQNKRPVSFKIGNEVMVRKDKRKKGLSSKLFRYWYEPYTIIDQIGDVNFVIESVRRGKSYKETVHSDKLKTYIQRTEEFNEPA